MPRRVDADGMASQRFSLWLSWWSTRPGGAGFYGHSGRHPATGYIVVTIAWFELKMII